MQPQIFKIVFEDADLLVIEKLAAFNSQRADRGEKEGLNDFIERALQRKVFPVHRLDREVLGLMIFALNRSAGEDLSKQFKERQVIKVYQAEVWGRVAEEKKTLVHFLKKNEKTNYVTVFPRETPGAKRAELSYHRVGCGAETTDLLVHLKTGRPHQIRAQLAKMGHPIVGDTRYGKPRAANEAIRLRSVFLEVTHPRTRERCSWSLADGASPKMFFAV